MDASGITVHVNGGEGEPVPTDLLERAVRETLAAEGYDRGEVSLTLLGDDAIRDMNRAYLGRDHVTDVISFAMEHPRGPLGDVYVGIDQARRQAAELGIRPEEELVRLTVHGTLHALGHEHPDVGREESPMYARQEALVSRILRGHD